MAKFHGVVGFAITEETSPGIWNSVITEREYYGDVVVDARRLQTIDQLNDDISVSNRISIIVDAFANEKFHAIRFVEYMGTVWKVINAEVQRPRLILTLGGVYNGPRQTRTTR
jgi:hypothetical protein